MKLKIDYYKKTRYEGCNITEYSFYNRKKHIATFEVLFIRDKAELNKNNANILEDISSRYGDCIRAASYVYKKLELKERDVSHGVIAIISESYVLPEYRNKHIFTILLSDIIEPSSGLIADRHKYGALLIRFIPSNGLSFSPFLELSTHETEMYQTEIDNNLNSMNKYGWTIVPSNIAKYANNEFAYKSIESLGKIYKGLTADDWDEEFWCYGEPENEVH